MKNLKIVFEEVAQILVEEQYEYYLTRENEDLAERFLASLETSTNLLRQFPRAGWIVGLRETDLGEVRCVRLDHFDRILVYYCVEPTFIRVFAVIHGSRDLAEILGRLGISLD